MAWPLDGPLSVFHGDEWVGCRRRAVAWPPMVSWKLLSRLSDRAIRPQVTRHQDKLATALHDETVARLEAEARAKALVTEVEALRYELSHLGQARDSALALKAARETEVSRLKKVESEQKQKLKREEDVGRQLAEQRVVTNQAKLERDRAVADLRALKHSLIDAKREGKAEVEALVAERDALEVRRHACLMEAHTRRPLRLTASWSPPRRLPIISPITASPLSADHLPIVQGHLPEHSPGRLPTRPPDCR